MCLCGNAARSLRVTAQSKRKPLPARRDNRQWRVALTCVGRKCAHDFVRELSQATQGPGLLPSSGSVVRCTLATADVIGDVVRSVRLWTGLRWRWRHRESRECHGRSLRQPADIAVEIHQVGKRHGQRFGASRKNGQRLLGDSVRRAPETSPTSSPQYMIFVSCDLMPAASAKSPCVDSTGTEGARHQAGDDAHGRDEHDPEPSGPATFACHGQCAPWLVGAVSLSVMKQLLPVPQHSRVKSSRREHCQRHDRDEFSDARADRSFTRAPN
jgi:hypothetical protein